MDVTLFFLQQIKNKHTTSSIQSILLNSTIDTQWQIYLRRLSLTRILELHLASYRVA